MSERKDLTRWNRAGRSRFEYVDGNAIEFLEILRQQLAKRFENTDWLEPGEELPENEQIAEDASLHEVQKSRYTRDQRITQMYQQEHRDWGWEISRTFARACHVLTVYSEAWSNEGYLGTSTQWDNVRRLVELLDYHPAPPASATTPLVLNARKDKSGLVAKGFQVKNRPPMGGDKVVFETLEDITIDEALNVLRPEGWDKSESPVVDTGAGTEPRQFSPLANLPIIHIQGIGSFLRDSLNNKSISIISDFYEINPETLLGHRMGIDLAWEFKAKAMTVCNFIPGMEWEAIDDWLLPDIVHADSTVLSELTGNSLEDTRILQLGVALIGVCLDMSTYIAAPLSQLQVPLSLVETNYIFSPWRAGKKPKVDAGQVALVYDKNSDKSEAVTIAKVDKKTQDIHLLNSPLQYSWPEWLLKDAVLRIVPRWTRNAWLNGDDVVRTEELHGLTADSYVCWKDENNDSEYHYAMVMEADKRSLRLKVKGDSPVPHDGAGIMVALPIETSIMSADNTAINADDADVEVQGVELSLPAVELPFQIYKLFQIDAGGGALPDVSGGLLPPASLPGLGSFLFPSPLLPIDLVKAAIELMLSMGIMVIPSTGEPVFKGMPFSGLLQGLPDLTTAAAKMVEMLDNMKAFAVWKSGLLVYRDNKPAYIDATCDPDSGSIPVKPYKTSAGDPAVHPLSCSDGKIIDNNGETLGYQPHYTDVGLTSQPADDTPFAVTTWNVVTTGKTPVQILGEKVLLMETLLSGGGDTDEPAFIFQGIKNKDTAGVLPEPLLAVLSGQSVVRGTVVDNSPVFLFDGVPDKIEPDDWIAGKFGEAYQSLRIKKIQDYNTGSADKVFSLSFEGLSSSAEPLEKIYADFRGELVAKGAEINETLVTDSIELPSVPDALTQGKTILLGAEGKEPVESTIVSIIDNVITTDPAASDFTKGELLIYGNVVKASHGISKPVTILGSGDAKKINQEFILDVAGISFTPDATKRTGVAASIDVEIAGRLWEQVSSLKDSAPDDHHYVIRMTEESYLKILFGDGRNGRSLPSGKNNIKVKYRVGSGLAGNLSVGSLDEAVKPHPLVDSVLQPATAAGGGDMESIDSLRENAPSTLLALERAVSLTDFADLAKGRSNVWQASAHSDTIHTSRIERVIVTVLPAGGAWSSEIESDITDYLQAHALPGIEVIVKQFSAVTDFDMNITLRIKSSAFLPDEIIAAVESILTTRFSLEQSRLGDNLYLSEVYKHVEGVVGVENSICDLIQAGEKQQLINAENERSAIYLNPARLLIDWEEYSR